MRKFLLVVSALCLSVAQVCFAEAELKPDHPDRYTVVKGDTLWDISGRFLQSPWLWPEIWHANQQIENPHLIYPGDVIGLVYIGGKPHLTTLKRGENSGVIKLSPQARITPISTAIPAIPLDAISSFMTESRIVDRKDFEGSPYVLMGRGGHLMTGAGSTLYARGDVGDHRSVGVYRPGNVYVDPDSEEFLGLEARSIALGDVKSVDDQVVTLALVRSNEEVMPGDRLLATENRTINSVFHPSVPEGEVRGKMIAVLNGVSQIGQYAVVAINQGEREGIIEGNVLAIYKKGSLVRDPYTKEKIELPSERAGVLMIFRTFEKVSYGLILKAERPLAIMDEVRNP